MKRARNNKPTKNTVKAERKPKQKKNIGKILLASFGILLVCLIAFMGINHFEDTDLLAPIADGKINVLMLGVDESGLRTDAIMLASYNVNEGNINLLSVPRDTKIRIENKKITKKINSIHAMTAEKSGEILGIPATAEAVTTLTGLPINYYVEFSFASIDHLFDALGPVKYDVPDVEGKGRGMNYDDPYQNLHIHLEPGMQKLTGNQVQQFLRYRKSNYHVGTGSDIDRVARQQEFIKAVVDQKVNAAILLKMPGIYSQLSKEIKTNISIGDITKYIRYIKKLSADSVHSYSLPGNSKMIGGASYFVCDIEGTQKLVSEVFGSENKISDKVIITGNYSQKPLKAGNVGRNDIEKQDTNELQKPQTDEISNKADRDAEDEPDLEPDYEEEADGEDVADLESDEEIEYEELNQNKTPLEEIYDLDE